MKYKELFDKWGISNLKLNLAFLEVECNVTADDREAAWEMYVELITRTLTQELEYGDEATALASVYSLFPTTRVILKEKGRKAVSFSKVAVVILNQIVRPFTAKWHQAQLNGAFNNVEKCKIFREELTALQICMKRYAAMLAEIAQVEDISEISAL